MAEYIEREMALKAIDEYFHTTNPDGEEQIGVLKSRRVIRALPTADVVSLPVVRQIQWERDIAMQQLEEHGIPFCGKADVVPVKHGRWEECDWVEYDGHGECVRYPHEGCVCTNCRNAFKKEFVRNPRVNVCPNCGAKMMEG